IQIKKESLVIKRNKYTNLKERLISNDLSSGKQIELNSLKEKFKEKCWNSTRKYKEIFRDAFEGTLADKNKFKNKLLEHYRNNKSQLKKIDDLKKRTEIL